MDANATTVKLASPWSRMSDRALVASIQPRVIHRAKLWEAILVGKVAFY
jgi:hypothetical protein